MIFHPAGIRSVSAEHCDFYSYSSPLCKRLTRNINKTPWRVCQQDFYQGEDTLVERVKGERRANPGREAERCVKTSILKLYGNACVGRKVVYVPNRGRLLLPSRYWLYNRASCSSGRELHQLLHHRDNSKLWETPTWCNTCEMEKSEPETGPIRVKGEEKREKMRGLWIWIGDCPAVICLLYWWTLFKEVQLDNGHIRKSTFASRLCVWGGFYGTH